MQESIIQTLKLYRLDKLVKILIDIFVISFTWFLLFQVFGVRIYESLIFFTIAFVLLGFLFGIYSPTYRYFTLIDLFKLIGLTLITFAVVYLISLKNQLGESLSLNLLFATQTSLISPRLFYRVLLTKNTGHTKFDAIIFGAGENGIFFKRAYQNNLDFRITAFIDDDKSKSQQTIDGIPVYHFTERLIEKLKSKNITHIIFSTDNMTLKRKNYLLNLFTNNGFVVLRLPNQDEIINQNINQTKILEFKVDELLTRDEIEIDQNSFEKFIEGKSILVTGGCGSIGSEIVSQLIKFKNCEITVIDKSEIGIFNSIKKYNQQNNIEFKLLDITNKNSLHQLFQSNQFDIIFNAAAYKHVPIFEENAFTGFKNNVIGCENLIELADKFGVDKFILVSSDKAVNPTNLMGASKRVCEILCNIKAENSDTIFISTRFGNVLDSSGSVVPTFKSQIQKGGPVTITDFKIERYFMTIPEAAKLVLEATRIGENSQIYVFDMGDPVKIIDLARKMILLSGKTINDIRIEEIGLRKGEKLYEELFLDQEVIGKSKQNENLLIGRKIELSQSEKSQLKLLIQLLQDDNISEYDNFDISSVVKEYNQKTYA